MTRFLIFAGMLLALTVAAAGAATTTTQPAASGGLEVTFDRNEVSTVLGGRFTLRSRITNPGTAPTDRLLAHLNVASLTSDVYVDPEDWSASRSRYLAPLGPSESTSVTWDIQAVNAGSFDTYVVVLPNGAASAGKGPLAVSPPVHLQVAGRRTLNVGGVLPVVAGVPVLLGLVAAGAWLRTRRVG